VSRSVYRRGGISVAPGRPLFLMLLQRPAALATRPWKDHSKLIHTYRGDLKRKYTLY
jgi:hypothetical protein